MANLKDLIVNGSARILGTLYAPDIKNTQRITEFIVGTQTASTGSWTGVTQDTILYDGKNINYFLPYAGSGNASLNLTLASGTTTGAKPIYLSGTSYVTTQYDANSCINMTYNATKGAWFVNADRNTQDVTRLQWSNNIKASTAITANRVIVGDANGYKNITANATFDISYPILYSKSAINATATGTNNWQSEPAINLANNKSGWTGTNYSVVYLVGTLSGTTFTIDSTMLTTTKPTTEDGKIYTPLGVMYSTTNCYFRPTNQYYIYKNGSFQPYGSGGSDSLRNIGEIVASTLPLTDAGLHLLDGGLILGGGIYQGFVDYTADLYTENPSANYFAQPLPEQDWIQPILSSNGVLGGDSFACAADSNYNDFYAYKALDGNTSTSWQSNGTTTSGTWFKFYNPTPIKVTQITWSGTPTYGTITGGIIYGSNDDLTYTQLGTFSGGTTKGGTINLSTNTNFYKYYKITPTTWTDTSGTFTNGWAKLTITAKTQSKTAEQVWQDSISQYGVCGKFVYDSTNNTIRLPKITGILEGTTDVNALGDLVEAGLPNITGSITNNFTGSDPISSGCMNITVGSDNRMFATGSSWRIWPSEVDIDASRSSSIYGNSSTVQPQTIKCFVYIVIATSTKTDIQVDIDNIATDLNGKADTDLTNTTPSISFATAMNTAGIRTVVETYVNGTSWYRIYSDGWCEQGGATTSTGSSNRTIALSKGFVDTNYTVNVSFKGSSYREQAPSINITSGSSFTIVHNANVNSFFWYACGYIN